MRVPLGRIGLRFVLIVEDVLQAALVAVVGRIGGRQVTVLPFSGHGTPELVHVRARVVLGLAAAPPVVRPAASGRAVPWRMLRESLGRFLTVELPRSRVVIHTPVGRTSARCDRQGYLDVVVDGPGLAPGWQELPVTATWRGRSTTVPAPVLVVDPGTPVALISDVDDTVIETGLTRGLEFLRLTLLTQVTDRVPLPGAAELYRALTAPRPDGDDPAQDGPGRRGGGGEGSVGSRVSAGGGAAGAPVFYLSTSPWNLYDLLARFIELRGFPAGPLLLTDWGPSPTGLLRIPAERHKLTLIRQVLAEHPGIGVVLIGDTGQLDPEIYATVATETPDRVRAVYVRRTAHIAASRAAEVEAVVRRVGAAGVPMLAVDDSVQIAEHAASIGLIDRRDVQAVRDASGS